jgi:hypothetical protein
MVSKGTGSVVSNSAADRETLRSYRSPTLIKGPALAVVTAQVVIVSGAKPA